MAPLYNLSAKYFQKNKERLHEKACERHQNLSKDKKQSLDEYRKIILKKAKKLYDNEDITLFMTTVCYTNIFLPIVKIADAHFTLF